VVVAVGEEEVAEVDGDADALAREGAADLLVDGKLHAARDGERLVDAERGGSEEDGVSAGAGHHGAEMLGGTPGVASHLGEETPVPRGVIVLAPCGRAISPDQAVAEDAGTLVGRGPGESPLGEAGVASARPQIMAARSH